MQPRNHRYFAYLQLGQLEAMAKRVVLLQLIFNDYIYNLILSIIL